MTSFTPHHALVAAPGARPTRALLVLHGILGSGGNFRSFVKRLADADPSWCFALVDLREHGQSLHAPPPHTIARAAHDLTALRDRIDVPIAGVMGHSFGGKVALAYAGVVGSLDHVIVLDSSIGARVDRSGATEGILRMLREIPAPLPSRERFLDIVRAHGHPKAIAEWLAMNVRREGEGFALKLDLDAIEALLRDYLACDLWPTVERAAGAARLDVVAAGRSDALDESDRARLSAIAARDPRVHAHVIPTAGHWLHVDAPDALFEIVRGAIA